MTAALLAFAVLATIIYLITWRMRRGRRLALATAIFVIPIIALIAWIVTVGDRAPPDSVTVQFPNAE